jgi:hypothetical protein
MQLVLAARSATASPWNHSRGTRYSRCKRFPPGKTMTALPGSRKVARFSLHAGLAAQAGERHKLERLCRYISRPAVSEKCLSLTPSGNAFTLSTVFPSMTPMGSG